MSNTPAHLWALAVPGILTYRNDHDHTLLGGATPSAPASENRARVLHRDWGVQRPEDLLGVLHWLASEGHRKEFNDICTLDLATSADALRRGVSGTAIDDPKVLAMIRFTRRHRARVGERSLLAWDMARLISVAGWGYLTQSLSEGQAWSFIWPAAQAVQRAYGSWQELGEHYLLGREFWSGEWDGGFARCLLSMLSDPASPWRALPWGMDLSRPDRVIPLQDIGTQKPPAPGPLAPLPSPQLPAASASHAESDAPDDEAPYLAEDATVPDPPEWAPPGPLEAKPSRGIHPAAIAVAALVVLCALALTLAYVLGAFESSAPQQARPPAPKSRTIPHAKKR